MVILIQRLHLLRNNNNNVPLLLPFLSIIGLLHVVGHYFMNIFALEFEIIDPTKTFKKIFNDFFAIANAFDG